MGKKFILTESEREQILNMHRQHGYKKPLNEEMEDVDLGARIANDSASDYPDNNPYEDDMQVIRKITQDINIGPNGIGGGPKPDNFNKIKYAFDIALGQYGDNYKSDDVVNALYHALYGFDNEDTSEVPQQKVREEPTDISEETPMGGNQEEEHAKMQKVIEHLTHLSSHLENLADNLYDESHGTPQWYYVKHIYDNLRHPFSMQPGRFEKRIETIGTVIENMKSAHEADYPQPEEDDMNGI